MPKRINCLDVNLTKGVKDPYVENYNTFVKETEEEIILMQRYSVFTD